MVLENRTVVTIAAGHTIRALISQHLTHKAMVGGAGCRLCDANAGAPRDLCRPGAGGHP